MNASQLTDADALKLAIRSAGGSASLIRLMNARGHSISGPSTISQWLITRVPAHYCPDIEFLTGVMCESLRPDVAWGIVRNSKKLKQFTSHTAPSAETAATEIAGPV